MTEQEKQALASLDFTFYGHKCTVAGTKMTYATITSGFPGFWFCSWGTVKEVAERDRNFTRKSPVFLSSWRWLGTGDELPEELRGIQ